MNDPTPDQSKTLARWIGRILHPYLLPIPTLIILLYGLPWQDVVAWLILVVGIVLLPAVAYAAYLERRGQHLYQRETRDPLYLIGWVSVLICLALIVELHAPEVLIACVAALAIWAPLQGLINARVTKISGHTAVATGCYVGLLLAGKLPTLPLQIGLLILVAVIIWARVTTRNHTLQQVVLGVLVGALPVLIVFPLVLTR